MSGGVLIVAPESASNSLGRALALAGLYARWGEVTVAVADTGPLWPGASAFGLPMVSFATEAELEAIVADTAPAVLVAVKPFRRSMVWATRICARVALRPLLVIDLDDDDGAIQRGAIRARPPWRRPWSVATADTSPVAMPLWLRQCLREADVLTVSSWALRGVVPAFAGPTLRVVHPRPSREFEPPPPAQALRIGFVGTPQRHKGMDELVRLLNAAPGLELHVLAPSDPEAQAAFAHAGVVQHPTGDDAALRAIYAQVDVVVLPQDPRLRAARNQTPMKLLDAMAFGRPTIATATPAVREIAGDTALLIPSWEDLDLAVQRVSLLRDPAARVELGTRARERFEACFSFAAQAPALAATLDAGLAERR